MSTREKMDEASVARIAKLSKIPLDEAAVTALSADFEESLDVVEALFAAESSDGPDSEVPIASPTLITPLKNVWREDEVQAEVMLSQAQALSGAKESHEGFFMVERVLKKAA